jgi:glycerol-3-phosphate dehydrogenase
VAFGGGKTLGMKQIYDLLVIGGGINGVGIARDAAGRGKRVILVEKDDLASHTSSASTKLVHGGLRYLEHYEFRLVRESLIERERLLGIAPHIIWPLRFVLPHDAGLRPRWMLRLGLWLYDHIGGRKTLPPTRRVDLRQPPHARVLKDRLTTGFEYSDCWVQDSRLVVLNALDACERGADIRPRTECIRLERGPDLWTATLRNAHGELSEVHAKAIANAAGPWVDGVLDMAIPHKRHEHLRLVKGSHLIFPSLFPGRDAYIFQNHDKRIVFAIPYEGDFTLVGTTDVLFSGDPGKVAISDAEKEYICSAVNEYLRAETSPDQAVWAYSGVRPLFEDHKSDNSTVTRDYVLDLDDKGGAPVLSIFGGKITTYRKLAEHALDRLQMGNELKWTGVTPLPGGDLGGQDFGQFVDLCQKRYPWLQEVTVLRYARAYGTRIETLLSGAECLADLGLHLGGDLFARELEYLVEHEFAQTADDVLWRRSKLGLHLGDRGQAAAQSWFENRRPQSGVQ